jgi:hypothetical protein
VIFIRHSAIQTAKRDLARRSGAAQSEIRLASTSDADFSGSPVGGDYKNYEYRADNNRRGLRGYNGTN